MPGSVEGGKKTAAKILAIDPDFYRKLGRKGGSAEHKSPRGFAAMDTAKVSAAGRKGGLNRRRLARKEGEDGKV